jgi:cold shock CspA family protein
MATGRVIRFDETKGYGFIAPSDGGEDVFVHANELIDRGLRISAGTRVGFRVLEGDRGLKAYDVEVIEEDQPPVSAQATNDPLMPNGTHSAEPALRGRAAAEDELCEVFPEAEFVQQITDLLLVAAPQLTGATIVELRRHLLQFARKNGWVE